jgi:hypothetical protein
MLQRVGDTLMTSVPGAPDLAPFTLGKGPIGAAIN